MSGHWESLGHHKSVQPHIERVHPGSERPAVRGKGEAGDAGQTAPRLAAHRRKATLSRFVANENRKVCPDGSANVVTIQLSSIHKMLIVREPPTPYSMERRCQCGCGFAAMHRLRFGSMRTAAREYGSQPTMHIWNGSTGLSRKNASTGWRES